MDTDGTHAVGFSARLALHIGRGLSPGASLPCFPAGSLDCYYGTLKRFCRLPGIMRAQIILHHLSPRGFLFTDIIPRTDVGFQFGGHDWET